MDNHFNTKILSFPPIVGAKANTLILGTIPSKASLDAGQYYAHPRNAFWNILGSLTGAGPSLNYSLRIDTLIKANIALWDILKSCHRDSSLDKDIRNEMPNDFITFFKTNPHITRIFFNGVKAETLFIKHVSNKLDLKQFACVRLPSTSPAYASMPYQEKLAAWAQICDH